MLFCPIVCVGAVVAFLNGPVGRELARAVLLGEEEDSFFSVACNAVGEIAETEKFAVGEAMVGGIMVGATSGLEEFPAVVGLAVALTGMAKSEIPLSPATATVSFAAMRAGVLDVELPVAPAVTMLWLYEVGKSEELPVGTGVQGAFEGLAVGPWVLDAVPAVGIAAVVWLVWVGDVDEVKRSAVDSSLLGAKTV